MRFMLLYKPGHETDAPPTPENMKRVGELIEDMAKAGVLLATDGLQPSSKGARVKISGGRFSVTDGPFTETKELIAGFAIVQLNSKEEAIQHAKNFLTVMGEGESEIRLMHDVPAFPRLRLSRCRRQTSTLRLTMTSATTCCAWCLRCHPVLSTESRVALTLRLLGGLTTGEIARAFLVPEPTIAQRIVRAKRTLAKERVPFEVPRGADRAARLSSVLEVIYLIFNEGYTATAGQDWMRPALCEDALRLGRVLAELAPEEPEVHGLVALMEIQASRLRARVSASGEPILLLDQDRTRWDQLLLRRGLAALDRAERLGGSGGVYALQGAVAACHARARTPTETDWARIVTLYEALGRLVASPVVELNRAVAVSMASGPQAGLALVDTLLTEPSLQEYHLLPSVRGDLLTKLGRLDEARVELERAASLTRNERERELLLARAAARSSPPPEAQACWLQPAAISGSSRTAAR